VAGLPRRIAIVADLFLPRYPALYRIFLGPRYPALFLACCLHQKKNLGPLFRRNPWVPTNRQWPKPRNYYDKRFRPISPAIFSNNQNPTAYADCASWNVALHLLSILSRTWQCLQATPCLAQNHPRLGIRSRLEIECHSMRKDFNQSINLHYLPIHLDRLPRLSSLLINDTRPSKSLTTAVWFSTRISRCAKRSQTPTIDLSFTSKPTNQRFQTPQP